MGKNGDESSDVCPSVLACSSAIRHYVRVRSPLPSSRWRDTLLWCALLRTASAPTFLSREERPCPEPRRSSGRVPRYRRDQNSLTANCAPPLHSNHHLP